MRSVEQLLDREVAHVGGDHAGFQLRDVEQTVKQFVDRFDRGLDPPREPLALLRLALEAQLRHKQVQGVQRLAQVMTCRCQKTRL